MEKEAPVLTKGLVRAGESYGCRDDLLAREKMAARRKWRDITLIATHNEERDLVSEEHKSLPRIECSNLAFLPAVSGEWGNSHGRLAECHRHCRNSRLCLHISSPER